MSRPALARAAATPLARPKRGWALPSMVALVALVTFVGHGFHGVLSRDMAIYTYAGQRVVDGVPPYAGILNRGGPLAHLLPGLGVGAGRLIGLDDVLAVRVLFMLISVAAVVVAYLLGRCLFSSPAAGLATAAGLLSFGGFITFASDGPRDKSAMVLFLLVALLAAVERRWLTAGVFLSLATLTLQTGFFTLAPVFVVLLFGMPPGRRLQSLVQVVVGGLSVLLTFVVYFTLVGALSKFVSGFLLVNARYTRGSPLTAHLAERWAGMHEGLGLSLWIFLLGLVAVVVFGIVAALTRRGLPGVPANTLVALAVGTVSGMLWTLRDFDGWPDLFPLLPVSLLGYGALAKLLTVVCRPEVALRVTLSWVLAATLLAMTFSVTRRHHRLDVQREAISRLLRELPRGASIVDVNAPQPLVLTGRTSPTRLQTFSAGLQDYVDDTYPGGLDGFTASLLGPEPDLVAVGPPHQAWMRRALAPHYRTVGTVKNGWTWYARASLGKQKLAALRASQRG